MKPDIHERARHLMKAVRVEGIGPNDREWLDRHLETCLECSSEARALSAALESLRSFPIMANPEVVRQTRMAVHSRAEQRRASRARFAPLWIATAMSSIWMILTTPYLWQAFAWFGHTAGIPNAVWQAGFLMWWFMPATVFAAAAAWRHAARDDVSNRLIESDRGL